MRRAASFSLDSQGVDVALTLDVGQLSREKPPGSWPTPPATVVWDWRPRTWSEAARSVETLLCGRDGCYTLTVYDSFGDGTRVHLRQRPDTNSPGTGSCSPPVVSLGFLESTEVCVPATSCSAARTPAPATTTRMPWRTTVAASFSCFGCADAAFCNYNADATVDDGSCADFDLCGVCAGDGSSCVGCTGQHRPATTTRTRRSTTGPAPTRSVGGICGCTDPL